MQTAEGLVFADDTAQSLEVLVVVCRPSRGGTCRCAGAGTGDDRAGAARNRPRRRVEMSCRAARRGGRGAASGSRQEGEGAWKSETGSTSTHARQDVSMHLGVQLGQTRRRHAASEGERRRENPNVGPASPPRSRLALAPPPLAGSPLHAPCLPSPRLSNSPPRRSRSPPSA